MQVLTSRVTTLVIELTLIYFSFFSPMTLHAKSLDLILSIHTLCLIDRMNHMSQASISSLKCFAAAFPHHHFNNKSLKTGRDDPELVWQSTLGLLASKHKRSFLKASALHRIRSVIPVPNKGHYVPCKLGRNLHQICFGKSTRMQVLNAVCVTTNKQIPTGRGYRSDYLMLTL